jgi:hypothetical protein
MFGQSGGYKELAELGPTPHGPGLVGRNPFGPLHAYEPTIYLALVVPHH